MAHEKIVNAVFIMAVLFMIYQSYIEYKKNREYENIYLTDHKNIEDKLSECENSNLYQLYKNLSDDDKKFLEIYINYARIKQKTDKPKYTKIYKGIKNQILISSIISLLLKGSHSSLLHLIKQNTLQQFGTTFF